MSKIKSSIRNESKFPINRKSEIRYRIGTDSVKNRQKLANWGWVRAGEAKSSQEERYFRIFGVFSR